MNKAPFTVTAANLNLADTADQVLYSFPADSNLVRIPRILLINRQPGTAYSITSFRQQWDRQKDFGDMGDFDDDRLEFNAEHQDLLMVYIGRTRENDSTERKDDPLFYIPVNDLGLTRTTQKGLAVLPQSEGMVFNTDMTSLILRTNGCGIASGTGNIQGELLWDEYPVIW